MCLEKKRCIKNENKNTSLLFSTKVLNCSALPHSSENSTDCVDIREVGRIITLLANLQCPMLVEKFGMHLTKRCYRKSSGQKILYHIEQEIKAPTFCCFILFHLSYSFPAESTKHTLVFTPSSMPRLAFLCYSLDTKCPTPSRVLCRELGPQLLSLL